MENNLITLLKDVLNSVQNENDRANVDNYILRCKNAEVLWYQPMRRIACVRFLEDRNKNEYHLRNKCGEFLVPGDQVKVYYTTNAAKGWIAVHCGEPNFMNEYGQNISNINDCCSDESGDCCETDTSLAQACQKKDKVTEVVEEWTERIEGDENTVREYEEQQENSPFKTD